AVTAIWTTARPKITLLLALAVLAACQSMQRAQPASSLEIVMTDDSCSPLNARVEAGSTVTVKIENRSKVNQTLQLMVYPLTIEPDLTLAENIYWQARVQPGFAVIEELPAPQMPGDYDFLCGEADAPDRSQGELTVVR
ncbi:MAG TPA: cupredoxin domain-containing protein, partial [Anaerolineaceae bacterium]|nr:cupredoxin domain-containing protein [Anaerolineaceae bacterium]